MTFMGDFFVPGIIYNYFDSVKIRVLDFLMLSNVVTQKRQEGDKHQGLRQYKKLFESFIFSKTTLI